MKNTESAFRWIVGILNKHQIPFQIAGGFAARLYGATRELADIDFDIPNNRFPEIIQDVKDYIVFGPDQYKDDNWDLFLMTLVYQGQEIDIAGSDNTMIFDKLKRNWLVLETDFKSSNLMEVYGLKAPIISKYDLIKYKTALAREVDEIDIQQIMARKMER